MGIFPERGESIELRKQLLLCVALAVLWSLIMAASLGWNISNERSKLRNLAVMEARSNFNKDFAFRGWAASHGGVYVPVTEKTQPNKYLAHIKERDIATPSGRELTLMNPAYMLRQMMVDYSAAYGIRGRITSTNSLNPTNVPEHWEVLALESFEQGETEYFEFAQDEGRPVLRLMNVLMVKQDCLKCHADQGYKVDDVRGGVGVVVPMETISSESEIMIDKITISHALIWCMGLVGVILGGRSIMIRTSQRIMDKEKLSESLREKKVMLAEIHHRVKNNLAIVSALLNLQAGSVADGVDTSPLIDSQLRIRSMALVHEMLYQDENFASVSARTYISRLVRQSIQSYGVSPEVAYNVDDVMVDLDTLIPLGLIINELVSNAIKHAYEGVESPALYIDLKQEDNTLLLSIRDNGRGLSKRDEQSEGTTLGMRLVQSLTDQLDGSLAIASGDDTSEIRTSIEIKFPFAAEA